MRIMILAFGSLITQLYSPVYNATLTIQGNFTLQPFQFPIGLQRLSSRNTRNCRLTAVVDSGSELLPIFAAKGKFTNLDDAVANLAQREGTKSSAIAFLQRFLVQKTGTFYFRDVPFGGKTKGLPQPLQQTLAQWLDDCDVDAAIWTGLEPNIPRFGKKCAVPHEWNVFPILEHDLTLYNNTRSYIQNMPKISSFQALLTDRQEISKRIAIIKENCGKQAIESIVEQYLEIQ